MIFNEDPELSPSKKYYLQSADKLNLSYTERLIELFRIDGDDLYYADKIVVNMPTVVLFRSRHDIDLELCAFFEQRNVRVINNSFCINSCNDKFATYELLEKHNISQPKTVPFGNGLTYNEARKIFGKQFVVKDRFGQRGTGVFLATNEKSYQDAVNAIDKDHIILQKYIEASYGKDLRVYVIGGKIAGAILRTNNSDFRANPTLGSKASIYELTDKQKRLARKIADAINGEIVSIDFLLIENDELVFCEANSNAGLMLPKRLSHLNLPKNIETIPNADVIIKYLAKVTEEMTRSDHKYDLWMIYEPEEIPEKFVEYLDKYDIKYEMRPIGEFRLDGDNLYYRDEIIEHLPKVVSFRFRDSIEFDLYKYFEKNGVRVVNNYFALCNSNDKLVAYSLFKSKGIKQPKTFHFPKSMTYNEIVELLGTQFIVKDRLGQNGIDVYLVNDENSFSSAVRQIDIDKILYQEYIGESCGKDLRVYIVGNKVIGSVLRTNECDFRANICLGATASNYELTSSQKKLALKIAKFMNGEVVAVDFLIKGDELILGETNSNAGIVSFDKLQIPVAEEIVKYIVGVIASCNFGQSVY